MFSGTTYVAGVSPISISRVARGAAAALTKKASLPRDGVFEASITGSIVFIGAVI
jgi:hypothetical protein